MALKNQAAALLVTVFGLPGLASAEGTSGEVNSPAFTPYYVDENSGSYVPQVADVKTSYAR